MRNLTRDPFHKLVGSNYCKNLGQLKITVDGQELDSRYIVNVYRATTDGVQYVEMFERDDNGMIVEKDDKPVTYRIQGDIEVTGVPRTCGCWRGKQIKNWWHKINQGRAGW